MDFKELANYVIEGNAQGAAQWTDEALAQKVKANDIINGNGTRQSWPARLDAC